MNPKLIPHAVTFLAPEGFQPAHLLHVAMSPEGKFFVNAPFDNPPLALMLAAHGLMATNQRVAQALEGEQKEESRIIVPKVLIGNS